MFEPTKIRVILAIVFVGFFIFASTKFLRSGTQPINYAVQVDDFKTHGVPSFDLPLFNVSRETLEGHVSLDEIHSAVTVVNFWASWCEPCKAEFASLVELARRFSGDDRLTVVAITVDKDLNALAGFIEQTRLVALPLTSPRPALETLGPPAASRGLTAAQPTVSAGTPLLNKAARLSALSAPKNFKILVDKDFLVPQRYSTKKIPETYLIDRHHKLIMKVIDEQNWLSPEFLSFLAKNIEAQKGE